MTEKALRDIYEGLRKGKPIEVKVEDGVMIINPERANLIILFNKGIVIAFDQYHLHLFRCEDKNEICWEITFNCDDHE